MVHRLFQRLGILVLLFLLFVVGIFFVSPARSYTSSALSSPGYGGAHVLQVQSSPTPQGTPLSRITPTPTPVDQSPSNTDGGFLQDAGQGLVDFLLGVLRQNIINALHISFDLMAHSGFLWD